VASYSLDDSKLDVSKTSGLLCDAPTDADGANCSKLVSWSTRKQLGGLHCFIEQKLEAWLGLKIKAQSRKDPDSEPTPEPERLEFLGYQIGLGPVRADRSRHYWRMEASKDFNVGTGKFDVCHATSSVRLFTSCSFILLSILLPLTLGSRFFFDFVEHLFRCYVPLQFC